VICLTQTHYYLFSELLSSEGATFKDLSSVTLLIGDMSQYAQINSKYVQHFESNPPVRVCVQAPITFPVVLSAIGHLDRAEKSDQGTLNQIFSFFFGFDIRFLKKLVD
jgi:hypothetical protein